MGTWKCTAKLFLLLTYFFKICSLAQRLNLLWVFLSLLWDTSWQLSVLIDSCCPINLTLLLGTHSGSGKVKPQKSQAETCSWLQEFASCTLCTTAKPTLIKLVESKSESKFSLLMPSFSVTGWPWVSSRSILICSEISTVLLHIMYKN